MIQDNKLINELSPIVIDQIFEEAQTQSDYLNELYRVAIPHLDDVALVDTFPEVSAETNRYIHLKAIAFDHEHHPDVFAGGQWMNSGFGSNKELEDWQVSVDIDKLLY
jgi:hypothetical protein